VGILLTAHEEGRQIGVPAVEPARRIRIPLRRGWTHDELDWLAVGDFAAFLFIIGITILAAAVAVNWVVHP
jgi:hypothetical protein